MCSSTSPQQVLNALGRHLSENGEVVSTSERFASCVERVEFVSGLLERFELWPRVSVSCGKSDVVSGEYREMGNRAFKRKEDGEALEMYTRSVAFAEGGSEALGLAFANRSAVLFERKLYRECLEVRIKNKQHFLMFLLPTDNCLLKGDEGTITKNYFEFLKSISSIYL